MTEAGAVRPTARPCLLASGDRDRWQLILCVFRPARGVQKRIRAGQKTWLYFCTPRDRMAVLAELLDGVVGVDTSAVP
jgi:hypothetical protein